ncbi:ADP-ribose diphosphatase [Halioglobus japonicus]|uniref:ADP-ribose pyrophosphatase n=1 Tax=Halioglobus japonicus TaxID=930805 RepID=A0AAP8SMR2_9GAMM|nr:MULTISPECIES: NUDIX domain-containing protein [Halioglobus]AQA17884.1 ADP-ribose diphosphatase [Halioglobus japonicus]KZX56911.1 ADP-ribose pyrophosphatase [Halioglobus sp. HI00S01]PLW85847.1 NUDIX domain-containing protein [Halioglobus japonicus]GHD17804.1 ADP-ribose pyrophosphatase [Halioglobus japonicus]
MPELTFGADDVRILAEETAFQGYFQVRRVTLQYRAFGGGWVEPQVREIFERGDAVGVLPYDPVTDSVVLIEQFRPGAMRGANSPWMLELIAGIVEPGEADAEVAHREAMEEAGCELSLLEPIATVLPSAGACTEEVRLFCGRMTTAAVGGVHGLPEEGEDILVHSVPVAEAFDLLDRNAMPNGHTLIALLWLRNHIESLRERWA